MLAFVKLMYFCLIFREFMNNVTDLIQYLGEFNQGKLLMVIRENYIKIIQRSSLRMYDVQLDLNNFLR